MYDLCSPEEPAAQVIFWSTELVVLQGTHDVSAVACTHVPIVWNLEKYITSVRGLDIVHTYLIAHNKV